MTRVQIKSKVITLVAVFFATLLSVEFGTLNGALAQYNPPQGSPLSNHYFIINAHTGKCLDVANRSLNSGAPVNQYRCHRGENQRWYFTKWWNNRQVIRNVNSGLCLDIPSSSRNNGARLQQSACHGNSNQGFTFYQFIRNSENGRFEVHHSRKCLDIPHGEKKDSVHVQQFTCHGGNNQQWLLVPAFGPLR